MFAPRRFIQYRNQNPPHFAPENGQSAVIFSPENFSKAKNFLGQEFECILFDARTHFNLDALAIACGTLRAGGELIFWNAPNFHIDLDSQRWSGVAQGIATPNFQHHFQALVQKYFPEKNKPIPPHSISKPFVPNPAAQKAQATTDQAQILAQILQAQSDLFIITAKRGRGKSALAGLLYKELTQSQCVWVTAPNKSAVKTLQDFSNSPIHFIAPDELAHKIEQNPQLFGEDWLLIDEAAMLPLPLLFQLCTSFKHIVLTTTIHSYEGTGRGFLLKFLPNLHRTYQHFELSQPLRWAENDPLEAFIDELLLLEAENEQLKCPHFDLSAVQYCAVSQQEIVTRVREFYGLLTLAHYRTSPLDLRRLFDAPLQQFYLAEQNENLLGGAWLVEEGAMNDDDLIAQIMRGERRPKGNLVAQALAFYYLEPLACRLKSLRLSRIAVQPDLQHQGIGQQLMARIVAQADVDFVSVSFGYTPELARFWKKCGFDIVQLGEHQEASSGCYSAIALCGISPQGQNLAQGLHTQFQRDIGFSFHPLASYFSAQELNWTLDEYDWESLKNFAESHRVLSACLPAIRRLIAEIGERSLPLLAQYCQQNHTDKSLSGGQKSWLKACRLELLNWLKQNQQK